MQIAVEIRTGLAKWHTGSVPRPGIKAIRELRRKYHDAQTAHLSCLLAVTDAIGRGESPTQAQLDAEANAARAANDARDGLRAAMAEH